MKRRLTVLAAVVALLVAGSAATIITQGGSSLSDADQAHVAECRAAAVEIAAHPRSTGNRARAQVCVDAMDALVAPAASLTTTVAPTTSPPTTAAPTTTTTVASPSTTCTTTLFAPGSITNAANALSASGVLCLSGTFTNQTVVISRGIVQSAPGTTAVIDGTGVTLSPTSDLVHLNGGGLVNVEVRNSAGRSVTLQGSARASGLNVHHSRYNGILAAGTNNVIENNHVWATVLVNANSTSTTGWTEAINTWQSSGTVVRDNNVHDNWGEGIDFINSTGGSATGNRVCDNYSVGVYVDGSSNITIANNRVGSTVATYDRAYGAAWGVLVSSESGGSVSGITINDNEWTRVSGPVSFWNISSSVATQSNNVTTTTACSSAQPPIGGYFPLTAPGTPFKTDDQCAAEVHRSTWEPTSRTASNLVPAPKTGIVPNSRTPQPVTLATNPDWTSTWNNTYRPRITGNFSGTTDEIIQWAACKWGWSDEYVRGEAVDESHWKQLTYGDTSSTATNCVPRWTVLPCPTSFGFLQVKWYYNPSRTLAGNSWPLAEDYTAFNIDYTLAELRGCYDGMSTYLGATRGDVWGCIGSWYSGGWHDSAAESYITRVKQYVAAHEWLGWAS